MSKTEVAKSMGYEVIRASPVEAGLIKNGKGIRTWWLSQFGGSLPGLDYYEVQEAIRINEEAEHEGLG